MRCLNWVETAWFGYRSTPCANPATPWARYHVGPIRIRQYAQPQKVSWREGGEIAAIQQDRLGQVQGFHIDARIAGPAVQQARMQGCSHTRGSATLHWWRRGQPAPPTLLKSQRVSAICCVWHSRWVAIWDQATPPGMILRLGAWSRPKLTMPLTAIAGQLRSRQLCATPAIPRVDGVSESDIRREHADDGLGQSGSRTQLWFVEADTHSNIEAMGFPVRGDVLLARRPRPCLSVIDQRLARTSGNAT